MVLGLPMHDSTPKDPDCGCKTKVKDLVPVLGVPTVRRTGWGTKNVSVASFGVRLLGRKFKPLRN